MVVTLTLVIVGSAGVAAAHGTHATLTPQVSAGSVVVEEAALSEPGYLVIRADDDGEPGQVLGVRALDRGRHTGVAVALESSLRGSGPRPVWAVIHADDGDGRFDPESDPLRYRFGAPAGDRAPVRPGERPVHVLTRGAGSAPVDAIRITTAALAADGHLVVHAAENGTLGPVRGTRSVPAGRHTNVTVPVENASGRRFAVVLHRDDGDGRFDPEADPAVRVGTDPVASRYEALSGGGDTELEVTVRTATDAVGSDDGPPVSRAANTDNAAFGVLATVLALLAVLAFRRR